MIANYLRSTQSPLLKKRKEKKRKTFVTLSKNVLIRKRKFGNFERSGTDLRGLKIMS